MSNLLNGFQASVGSANGKTKKEYSLTEVLGIMQMFKEGMKVSQVAELVGRTAHSLRYKFLEGEIVLNGVRTIRSIRKYSSAAELYTAYKVAIPADINADVKVRIQNWKDQLSGTTAEVSEASAESELSTEATEEVA